MFIDTGMIDEAPPFLHRCLYIPCGSFCWHTSQQDALEVTQRLVDQVDDHFGRAHGVYGSALSDMALMMKSTGRHQEATETYLKALEVYVPPCRNKQRVYACSPVVVIQ